jgi:hypothetical protein
MSDIKKYLSKLHTIEIDGDKIEVPLLGAEYLPHIFKVQKAFSGMKENGSMEDLFKNFNDEGMKAISDIINITVNSMFPDAEENDKSKFATKYAMQILMAIMQNHSGEVKDKRKENKLKAIEELRAKHNGSSESDK